MSLRRAIWPVAAALVLVASCSGDDDSSSDTSAAATTTPTSATTTVRSPPTVLDGTWRTAEATLTLTVCDVGEECGRLELIDENGRHCVYALTYVSEDASGFRFETPVSDTFACAWSPWSDAVVRLSVTDDTAEIVAGDPHAFAAIVLTRADS